MIAKYFQFDELNTDFKTETIAGFTTFVTMAYIIIVNPKILQIAGIPVGPSMVATILSAFFGTLAMGVYAKRPFAIAPYMGENAFITYTVVKVLGFSWQTALGAIFISGVLFTILTTMKIRGWLANAIPESLKIAFAVGIGFFLAFIGLNETGIITIGVPGAPVKVGNLHADFNLLAIVGILIIAILMIKKVNAAILIGIVLTTILGFVFGTTPIPENFMSMPPDISEIFLALDITGALTWGFFAVILTVLVLDFVDTMGTLIGVSYRAGFLDENGNLPDIEKPMLCDSTATIVGALLGTTTTGTFIESAAGIEAGGRSGFTSVVTALLFLVALFFAPILTVVPSYAYGSALIIVGMLMLRPIARLNFDDLTDVIPAFLTIALMSFTYNIGIGMTAGFVIYPIAKLVGGKTEEIHNAMWALFGVSILFYVFYPY
ncbi:Xanthine/uracil/thiamine/ascorbate permease family protein [hydrothermal vent metagenome]|uniref:Xanthine/uracil/thiamine/ascorbate permease family protein n=1 Tax=hydrothermal vent metagenome TaxID=652676 RepID=A0A3B1BTZ9_9ZZZZ